MDIEIRAPRDEEADAVFALCSEAFTSPPEREEPWRGSKRMEDFLCAWSGAELVGTTEVMAWGQFFGGRSVPMGAVASVAVRPDQRGQGIAPRLLNRAVERMHDQGLVISTLHPATTRFYRGLGWEIGGEFGVRRVPTVPLAALPPGEPECLRPGRATDFDAVRECYERIAPSINGAIDRSDIRWRADRTALDRPHRYLYVYDGDGQIDGYVVYDQHQGLRQWGFAITVHELVAADARAAVTLWRHIGSHVAQVDAVTVLAMPLDALTLLLPEQVVEFVAANHWMTRVVDAAGAISARGYPAGVRAEVHVQLADRLAPWNDGRFVLRVEGGEGKLTPGGTGDVHLSVNALASLYTGWATAPVLAAAGLLHHAGPREIAALDVAFAGPRPYLFDNY
ncbi:MAG TPA: GNAT family N-acetyltransferase [Acidimicrobiia bacterium]|jgi:predicted acetyltransferase|nr:GNAT family N-acetyltransferase [Acidimicrobiia bacterium]